MSSTIESVPQTGFDAEQFEAFVAARQEPEAIVELRRSAFETFIEKNLAPLDPEEFKRVDLRAFRPSKFSIAPPAANEAGANALASFGTLLRDRAEFAGNVSHVDGRCVRSELSEELRKKGVLFGDLATLLKEHADKLLPHLMTKAVTPDRDRFSAWHAAFFTGGTVLYVPRNVEVSAPLHSFIGLAAEGAADFSHTLIVLEDGASATLLEETASLSETNAGLHVGAVELILGREARLRYVQLQNWNEKTWHLAHQGGRVASNAFLQWTVGGLGSKLAHIHQDIHLDGKGAEAQVNGVTFAVDRQHISYYTQQSHNAESCRSDLLYKTVLRDKSRVVWRGMIRVEEAAQKTDGYQRCDSLMLSDTCRSDSIPGLEIEADDVKCTHGATTGRVDEEQVFYCMSRGITRYEAMHMIVEGFFQGVFDRIPVEAVRETLSQAVIRKLGFGE